ncbi:MAG: DsbA family protein [Gammaproteobacteria bacterium]|nr:DsbA family protein [Gammaproteobacteria bacterium]
MKERSQTLIYIHDPMCSWCWGFRPVWQQIQQAVAGKLDVRYVLGGLAADTDEPMPEEMRLNVIDNWRRIQREIPGTEFNYDFWTRCSPRRSTYPACRAIIACRMQQPELESEMLLLIQQAYYLLARNPSDLDVLVALAEQLGLDTRQFVDDIQSEVCQNVLLEEIEFCREINISSFPSLVLKQGKSYTSLDIDYNSSTLILSQLQ